jgi:DNA-binding MarR family transcriptional regulator
MSRHDPGLDADNGKAKAIVEGTASAVSSIEDLSGWKLNNLDYPTFRITLLAKIMDRLTIRQFTDKGDLTYAEWRVLSRLGTLPEGGTVGHVAELAWVDRAEVSRAAAALELRGLTSRRENAQDRRKPILFLTPVGRKLYFTNLAERSAFHEALLVDLTDAERALLDTLLLRVGQRLLDIFRDSTRAPD